MFFSFSFFFFFFQAEDGIRDIGVTGVQTCALPICTGELSLPYPLEPRETSERCADNSARCFFEARKRIPNRVQKRRHGLLGRPIGPPPSYKFHNLLLRQRQPFPAK